MYPVYDDDKENDLLGMLVRAYHEELEARPEAEIDHMALKDHMCDVQRFIDWARARLRKTPVVGTYPVAHGLGVRLQDGTGVPFLPQPPERPMLDEAVHVTHPGFNPATDLVASPENMPITGRPRNT